jgi:hypothetical protein
MYKLGIAAVLAVLGFVAQAQAGHRHCCGNCGCNTCNMRCRLVCEEKNVITYDWAVDCEPYCLPGIGGCKVGEVCLRDAQTCHGCRIEGIWKPNCCNKIKIRRTPVKIPIVTKVPSYRCVVECICGNCGHCSTDLQASAEATQELEAQGVIPTSAETAVPAETATEEAAAVEAASAPEPQTATQSRPTTGLMKAFFGR